MMAESHATSTSPAERLAEALARRGMTGAELARALGVSAPTVHAWLHGAHGLRWGNVSRAAAALGVSASWLMFGAAAPNAPLGTAHHELVQTADEAALLRLYRELTDQGRSALLRRAVVLRRLEGKCRR